MRSNTNREAVKILELLSGKIDKYKYLIGEKILPSNRRQTIEQAKFVYSPLEKLKKKTNIKTAWCFKVPRHF